MKDHEVAENLLLNKTCDTCGKFCSAIPPINTCEKWMDRKSSSSIKTTVKTFKLWR